MLDNPFKSDRRAQYKNSEGECSLLTLCIYISITGHRMAPACPACEVITCSGDITRVISRPGLYSFCSAVSVSWSTCNKVSLWSRRSFPDLPRNTGRGCPHTSRTR